MSGVEIAAAVSASQISGADVQTLLISDQGLQQASYSPGDWLEPKDGSNQRMMIVGASQGASAASTASRQPVQAMTLRYAPAFPSPVTESAGGDAKTTAELQSPTGYAGSYADWNVDLDGDGSSDDPWKFGSATEYPVLNLGTLDIDHGNLNARPPIEPKANAALCSAVSNGQLGEVKAQIEAGVDVNDTCQTTTLWYNGLTPLAIAMKRGRTEIEAILVEAGAVDAESQARSKGLKPATMSLF